MRGTIADEIGEHGGASRYLSLNLEQRFGKRGLLSGHSAATEPVGVELRTRFLDRLTQRQCSCLIGILPLDAAFETQLLSRQPRTELIQARISRASRARGNFVG
jgi:hypothetical protein